MSRNEADREDLLREATALVERMECQPPGEPEAWVIGFRRSGAASLYVGADPVFQFNTDLEIRRAYFGGRLVKSLDDELFWLDRERTDEATYLVRTPLTASEADELLSDARSRMDQLEQAMAENKLTINGAVPDQTTVEDRTRAWLARLPRVLRAAKSPRA